MRTLHTLVLILILAAGAAPSLQAATGTAFEERISRLVGSPTPVGPARPASDVVSWTIELDAATVVWIEAESPANSPFYLTTSCSASTLVLPSSHIGILCTKPGTWRVEVDPAGGVAVDILLRLRGHVGDLNGAPSPFTLSEGEPEGGCVVPGVCLP